MDDLRGIEKNDSEALTIDQQAKLNSFKIKTRISNENYLRKHPEIDRLLQSFVRMGSVKQDIEWWKSDRLCEAIEKFHKEYASVPKNMRNATEDLKEIINLLQIYLKYNYNLCDEIAYTGSSFEELNICGENILEFDVMLIADRKEVLEIENDGSQGLCKLKCTTAMVVYPCDDDQFISAKNYREFFFGLIQKWANIVNKKIKLIFHGVATQINVLHSNGTIWYQVDLVPCFKIYDRTCSRNVCEKLCLCVPKPVEGKLDVWRLSYSLKEVEATNKLNSIAKKCIRFVKAAFKLRLDGVFKDKFTSYHIKTAALHLADTGWPDNCKENIGASVYTFLIFIKQCLEKRELRHRFNSNVNLLEFKYSYCIDLMISNIAHWLTNEKIFLKRLGQK